METKTVLARLQNYVETIVPQFNDGQFKAHFRLEGLNNKIQGINSPNS